MDTIPGWALPASPSSSQYCPTPNDGSPDLPWLLKNAPDLFTYTQSLLNESPPAYRLPTHAMPETDPLSEGLPHKHGMMLLNQQRPFQKYTTPSVDPQENPPLWAWSQVEHYHLSSQMTSEEGRHLLSSGLTNVTENLKQAGPVGLRAKKGKANACGPCFFQKKTCPNPDGRIGRCSPCEEVRLALLDKVPDNISPGLSVPLPFPDLAHSLGDLALDLVRLSISSHGFNPCSDGVYSPLGKIDIGSSYFHPQIGDFLLGFIDQQLNWRYEFQTNDLTVDEKTCFHSAIRYLSMKSLLSSIGSAGVMTRQSDLSAARKVLIATIACLGGYSLSILRSILESARVAVLSNHRIVGRNLEHRTMCSALEVVRLAETINVSSLSCVGPLAEFSHAFSARIKGERDRLRLYRVQLCDSSQRDWPDHVPKLRSLLNWWKKTKPSPVCSFIVAGNCNLASDLDVFTLKDVLESNFSLQHTPGSSLAFQSFGAEPGLGYPADGYPRQHRW